MIATTATSAIPADKFARIVTALATQFVAGLRVGSEWTFMVATEAEITAWVPRAGHLTLQLGDFDGNVWRTATVCPGEYRALEVVAGSVVIGEARTAETAFSTALDYLSAPLRAVSQHEHDAVSV